MWSDNLGDNTHLTALSQQEAHQYVKHHIEVAGRTQALFSDDVISEIYQHAKGLPRLIKYPML